MTYYFGAKAKNGTRLWGEIENSDGIKVKFIHPVAIISVNPK